ncbi:MAG: GNAT family N-acetyltransferase [Clostridium sp.]|uniref:GNAT family N-acetyltransferase n=1 Tax=Clostridium sp. TaxID=1506 RepID=UPI00290C2244|nr:GNAT family N-acetyltransferase [Clostridium sp.]MDU4937644.1 GNAT family N-acetyltransferase [Clostridium sp.]
MIYKLKDTEKAKDLFGNWEETIIWSCLQNIMGSIYVDDEENPKSAMAVLGDFCFLGGVAKKELVQHKPDYYKENFIIMVPQSNEWSVLIKECYGNNAKKITRYAIKKEEHIFGKDKLMAIVNSLPKGYALRMIDEEIFNFCRLNDWSKSFVAQYSDYEMFKNLGLGVVVMKDNEPISGAAAYSRYRDGIEVEIDTKEQYRRKGLAYCCGAKLILECLKRGLYPSWDAHNKASVALAEKLGYNYHHDYLAFEVWDY